jgi:hypothetical protein
MLQGGNELTLCNALKAAKTAARSLLLKSEALDLVGTPSSTRHVMDNKGWV